MWTLFRIPFQPFEICLALHQKPLTHRNLCFWLVCYSGITECELHVIQLIPAKHFIKYASLIHIYNIVRKATFTLVNYTCFQVKDKVESIRAVGNRDKYIEEFRNNFRDVLRDVWLSVKEYVHMSCVRKRLDLEPS